jgi:hypothetical protein
MTQQRTTEPSSANSAVVATLVAIGLGFVAGLLLAPKSGKDTTAFVKRKVRDAQGRFQSTADQRTGQSQRQIVSHFKRRRSRREIKCALCTPFRWLGNTKDRFKAKEYYSKQESLRDIRYYNT